MLLSNAFIEHSQHVCKLSDAAPAGVVFSKLARNDNFLHKVTYIEVSSNVKQCERAEISHTTSASTAGTIVKMDCVINRQMGLKQNLLSHMRQV